MKYKTIYADPPWPEVGGGKIKRGADKHYSLMSVHDIMMMSSVIKQIADDNCHLYLWTTNNYLPDALKVMSVWGFQYITTITWMKDRKGLGQYYRGLSEHCLFGRRGMLPYRTLPNGKRAQGVTAFQAIRTEHSSKPDEMRKMIDIVSHPPKIELFAREYAEGWDACGNEINSKICGVILPVSKPLETYRIGERFVGDRVGAQQSTADSNENLPQNAEHGQDEIL